MAPRKYVCLDVGERRVGIAYGDSGLRMAWPLETLVVDDDVQAKLKEIFESQQATDIVVGKPRNQSGEATQQTKLIEDFAGKVLKPIGLPIHWQDESVTSVMAEERLKASGKPYNKAEIDAQASAIILQDFLEAL